MEREWGGWGGWGGGGTGRFMTMFARRKSQRATVAVQMSPPPWWLLLPPPPLLQALVALQGRFFGGRQLYASFFDEQRFEASDLAPRPEELVA